MLIKPAYNTNPSLSTVMEVEQGSAFIEDKGHTLFCTDADLRDDSFLRLVEDFLGPQSGEKLHLDGTACKNKFLNQVGLLKEDRKVSWKSVLKWLCKIFPLHKSIDFRSLIEKSIETARKLNGEARKNFLESSVNFEVVGPECELLGIGRSDLLGMSDFSERVKGVHVTNGLMMELYNFIMQERIDPIVLVFWLRNFNENFCSDGKIDKAYKTLKINLHKLKLEYQVHLKNKHSFSLRESFLQTEFNLFPKTFSLKTKKPRSANQKKKRYCSKIMKKREKPVELSGFGEVASTMDLKHINGVLMLNRDENIVPLSMTTEEEIEKNTTKSVPASVAHQGRTKNFISVKEEPGLSSDEPHEAKRRRLRGTSVNADPSKEEVLTLLDLSMLFLQKLSSVYGVKTKEAEQVSKDLLQKHFTLMLQEDAIMREFNEKINKYQTDPCSVTPPLHFLDCNARFLLAVGQAVDQQIIAFEREICLASGERLGRDKNPKFSNFVNFSESAATRYIHMVCDILSPLSETTFSCERQWLNFCQMRNKQSKLAVARSNRFISYFECAASVAHHHMDIVEFFSDPKSNLIDRPNVVLESIKDDAGDQFIQALVCVLAIVYCKILGPYWQLLKSSEEYVSFRRYVLYLHRSLVQWSENASLLLLPESLGNIFHQFPLQESNFAGVLLFCAPIRGKYISSLIQKCLEKTLKTITAITEYSLKDFLPGGIYSKDPSLEQCLQLRSCLLSHLMGEYPFGHGYPYKDKGLVSSVALPPKPSLDSENTEEGSKLINELSSKEAVLAAVTQNGFLMKLDEASHSQKQEAPCHEINYQKVVLGKHEDLSRVSFSLTGMITNLKMVLPETGDEEATNDKLIATVLVGPENVETCKSESPPSKYQKFN